jgi:hypothetical protein
MGMGEDDLEIAAQVQVKTSASGQVRWASAVCIPRDWYHGKIYSRVLSFFLTTYLLTELSPS